MHCLSPSGLAGVLMPAGRMLGICCLLGALAFAGEARPQELEGLVSKGPGPGLEDKLHLFGQFVGSWDLEVSQVKPDGTRAVVPGEWHFAWALDGRAVQDVWIAPSREARRKDPSIPGEYGTTVRFYDPAIDAWRSTWIGPGRGVVLAFIGRLVRGEIVLEGRFEPGVTTRWVFFEIGPRSFRWRADESTDEGRTWKTLQEMRATRASAKGP